MLWNTTKLHSTDRNYKVSLYNKVKRALNFTKSSMASVKRKALKKIQIHSSKRIIEAVCVFSQCEAAINTSNNSNYQHV